MTGAPVPVERTDEAIVGELVSDVAGDSGPALAACLDRVLTAALAQVEPAARVRAPVLVAAPGRCTAAAARWIAHCRATRFRARPSESIGLEVTSLVARFAARGEWRGACFLLAGEGGVADLALLGATGMVAAARADAAVACEVAVAGPDAVTCRAVPVMRGTRSGRD